MAKAKSTGKKVAKSATKAAKGKAAPVVKAAAKKAPAVKATAQPAAPKSPPKAAATVKAPKPAAKPAAAEANWTDAIKAALERRNQQPEYPGAGADSWKRAKH
jgi:hypothetical protein